MDPRTTNEARNLLRAGESLVTSRLTVHLEAVSCGYAKLRLTLDNAEGVALIELALAPLLPGDSYSLAGFDDAFGLKLIPG